MAGPRKCAVLLSLLVPILLCLLLPIGKVDAAVVNFTATSVLLDCGANSTTTASTGFVWTGDEGTGYVSLGQIGAADASSSSLLSNTLDAALYRTARFFSAKGSYSFKVAPGRYWLRLHFVAFASGQFDPAKSLFSVIADQYSLLSNFTGVAANMNVNPLVFKEYSFNISGNSFSVTFDPVAGCYAFVNALELVSMPSSDFYGDDASYALQTVSIGVPGFALQTMYRLNVGGQRVGPAQDSGLSRIWESDESYIWGAARGLVPPPAAPADIVYPANLPEYTAPRSVYSTARTIGLDVSTRVNISWIFDVDSGFFYYVRLHFAEIQYTAVNQRVFNVFLNNATATLNLDLILQLTTPDTAWYKDYLVNMLNATDPTLWVQIGPTGTNQQRYDAILNGIEILKLNNSVSSLAGAGVALVPATELIPVSKSSSSVLTVVGAVVGAVAVVAVLGVVALLCYRARKGKKEKGDSSPTWLPLASHGGNSTSTASKVSTMSLKSGTGSYVSSVPSSLGRYFTFAELQEATNNFDEMLLLGVGGFGKVYRGQLEDGTKVAVKRGNPRSEQGMTEFQTEIEMLSKLRHRHLVSLIGYCEEHSEMILVYDYMANGPLRGHLYGSDMPALSWRQRLEICIGAARGLHYLHTGAEQGIIHRDVKTTNILLDENFVAKVADFGLSKTGPTLDRTHVSTAVKGSFGYLDPEYFRRQQLTEKSDVYSFGVVLMEVLCARPAINPALPREQVNMAEWVMHWQRLGMLDQVIDPKLKGYCNPESLKKFGEIAEKCLQEQGIDRPSMGDVLWNLEYALQLQETSIENHLMEDSVNRSMELPLRPAGLGSSDVTNATDSQSLGSQVDSEDVNSSAVFSQLVNPQGR